MLRIENSINNLINRYEESLTDCQNIRSTYFDTALKYPKNVSINSRLQAADSMCRVYERVILDLKEILEIHK